MKKHFGILLVLLLLQGCMSIQTPNEAGIAISEVLKEIQIAVDEINEKVPKGRIPHFSKAEVVLTAEKESNNSGGASIVLSGNKENNTTTSNKITLILTPKKEQTKQLRRTTGKDLANYVIEAVKAIDQNGYLNLEKLEIEAGFTVEKKGELGVEIEISSLTFGGKHSATSKSAHTLKLIFENEEG